MGSRIPHPKRSGSTDSNLNNAPGWIDADRFPSHRPTAFVTAIQPQLGLKLQAGKSPAEYLIVERIEHPTEI